MAKSENNIKPAHIEFWKKKFDKHTLRNLSPAERSTLTPTDKDLNTIKENIKTTIVEYQNSLSNSKNQKYFKGIIWDNTRDLIKAIDKADSIDSVYDAVKKAQNSSITQGIKNHVKGFLSSHLSKPFHKKGLVAYQQILDNVLDKIVATGGKDTSTQAVLSEITELVTLQSKTNQISLDIGNTLDIKCVHEAEYNIKMNFVKERLLRKMKNYNLNDKLLAEIIINKIERVELGGPKLAEVTKSPVPEILTPSASTQQSQDDVTKKLDGKSLREQNDTLYSAVIDLDGNVNHPIIKAYEDHMLKNGNFKQQELDGIKQAAANKVFFTNHATNVLTGKTPEQQIDILYSAVINQGGDKDHPIVKAYEDHMRARGSFTQEELDGIKQDGVKTFVANVLTGNTPEQQNEMLYFAVIHNGGDKDHPIVKAFEEHMRARGSFTQEELDGIKQDGVKAFVANVLDNTLPDQQAYILHTAVYRHMDTAHPIVKAFEEHMLTSGLFTQEALNGIKQVSVKASLAAHAVFALDGKSTEEQTKLLSEAVITQNGNKDHPIVKAYEDNMLASGQFTQEALNGIKQDAIDKAKLNTNNPLPPLQESVLNNAEKNPNAVDKEILSDKTKKEQADILLSAGVDDNEKITTAIEKGLATKSFTTEELSGIKAAAELERVKKATIVKREEQEIDKADKAPTIENTPEKLAQDSVIFGGKVESIGPKTLASTGTLASTDVGSNEDPITKAIRKEILGKQQRLLQTEIAANTKNPSEQDRINGLSTQEFRDYITTEGKEEAAKIFAKPEMQTVLNKIEVDGYKKVHNKFQENFQNVAWSPEASAPNQPKTKSCDITNDAGEVVASIKETTHDKAPISVTLDNGNSVQVNSYRTIEFPVDNKGKGPLHLSMAVKDENGKNIAEKDAVYFTAHYDDKGRLTEVSSPVPVKFMGKGDDAVGYIERNGKVYTLPVTQGNYKAMMQEVAKTKGMGVDLSREVEKPAQDLVMTKEKTVEPVLEKEKEKVELTPVAPKKAPELSADAIDLPKPSHAPIIIPPLLSPTGPEKTKQIDEALKDKSPEQIVATLKNQVKSGHNDIVGLIVEATKPGRVGDHTGVPQLTAEQFKEVYDEGMKGAKAIGNAPPKSTALNMTENLKLHGIQRACGKLAPAAKIDPAVHSKTTRDNAKSFATKSKQHAR